jgi:hypothetical protein
MGYPQKRDWQSNLNLNFIQMKKLFLLLGFLYFSLTASYAEDIYFYQSKFAEKVDVLTIMGLNNDQAFEKMIVELDSLQAQLDAEKEITKKEPLLSDIRAVQTFLGEIAPGPKSYMLDINQKQRALSILGLVEEEFEDSTSCMPITKIELWDNYNCYLVTNNSDSMMIKYKYNFLVQKKYSSYSGFVDAGVSVKCSRSIFESFDSLDIVFSQEKCVEELGIVRYIQPEIIQPKVETYAEPDYLSPQQKQALKKKMKEKLKKDKEKQKKQALKEKNKKKKELEKLRKQKKKEQIKARDAKKKAAEEKKKAALKAKKKK